MSSFKPLFAVACLLCLARPALPAEQPNATRSLSTDGRGSDSSSDSRMNDEITKEVGGKSFEDWLKELRNPDPSVRSAALVALIHFKQAHKAVAEIARRLDHTNVEFDASPRVKAAIALLWIETRPTDRERVMQALARAISSDPQSVVRYEAARTLKFRFCPINYKNDKEKEIITHLLASVGSASTYELREACIDALIAAGVDPEKGPNPSVTRALLVRANPASEPTDQVRLKAIMALGIMGRPQSPELWKQVQYLLKTSGNTSSMRHRTIRIWARVSLMALEEKVNQKDLDEIAKVLKDREAAMRVQAVTAFGALQDKARAYVGDLCNMVTGTKPEKDTMVLVAIATSLGNMKNNGANVQRALIHLTEFEDKARQGIVLQACTALAQLRLNGAAAIEAMEKASQHVSLDEYQKTTIKDCIKKAKLPPEGKPVKDQPKNLDKPTGKTNQRNR
jgi:HEAT repeat protein